MSIYAKIKSLRIELVIILIIAMLTIIIIDFTKIRINELFDGTADKINNLLTKLSLAYISSFIFYFLVVFLKEEKDKKNIYPYIKNNISSILSIHYIVIQKLSGIRLNKSSKVYYSRNEINEILEKVSPLDTIPAFIEMPIDNYRDMLKFESKHVFKEISVLYEKMKYLDSELLKILLQIENSNFLKYSLQELEYYSSRESNLVFFTDTYYAYNKLLEKLDLYTNKQMKKYY